VRLENQIQAIRARGSREVIAQMSAKRALMRSCRTRGEPFAGKGWLGKSNRDPTFSRRSCKRGRVLKCESAFFRKEVVVSTELNRTTGVSRVAHWACCNVTIHRRFRRSCMQAGSRDSKDSLFRRQRRECHGPRTAGPRHLRQGSQPRNG
jgi:hypothetical protein